jgi:hypothetical protein
MMCLFRESGGRVKRKYVEVMISDINCEMFYLTTVKSEKILGTMPGAAAGGCA